MPYAYQCRGQGEILAGRPVLGDRAFPQGLQRQQQSADQKTGKGYDPVEAK